jgi:hypothetical protein
MTKTVFLVVENFMDGGYEVHRAYSDRAEAEAFVTAHNLTRSGQRDIEEITVGAPEAEYDGPYWNGRWMSRRKLKGEQQLVLVAENGFVTVVPSAVPIGTGTYRYQEFFTGPGWRDLAHAPRYEEPAVWIDSFDFWQGWRTGGTPTLKVDIQTDEQAIVSGLSKDDVEQLLRETALQVKARRESA